ncbi:MAG: hypothetical protein A4E57_03015 [Syntrophorhabdaceae bacterium PtaU1.Bin034]|nr:MAG: hypothetical protein A4E57_03015 [Syntrophorhabdaceae bacterium PtaU1.Bin034]
MQEHEIISAINKAKEGFSAFGYTVYVSTEYERNM